MRRPRQPRASSDAGFTLASALVSMAILAVASALSVAIVTDGFKSSSYITVTANRENDSEQAIQRMSAVLANATIVTATSTEIVARSDETNSCIETDFVVDYDHSRLYEQTRAVTLPTGTRCADLDEAAWPTRPAPQAGEPLYGPVHVLAEQIRTNEGGQPPFAYYEQGNGPTSGTIPCDIALIGIRLTSRGAAGSTLTSDGSVVLNRRAFGAAC